jgi:hypothetical protein
MSIFECPFNKQSIIESPNHASGADGVKIAVFRKGRASLEFIWAAAQWRRWASVVTLDDNHAMRYYMKYDQIVQM